MIDYHKIYNFIREILDNQTDEYWAPNRDTMRETMQRLGLFPANAWFYNHPEHMEATKLIDIGGSQEFGSMPYTCMSQNLFLMLLAECEWNINNRGE